MRVIEIIQCRPCPPRPPCPAKAKREPKPFVQRGTKPKQAEPFQKTKPDNLS